MQPVIEHGFCNTDRFFILLGDDKIKNVLIEVLILTNRGICDKIVIRCYDSGNFSYDV